MNVALNEELAARLRSACRVVDVALDLVRARDRAQGRDDGTPRVRSA